MNSVLWFWLVAIIVLGGIEVATAGLVSIWFVCGAAAALIAAWLGASCPIQITLFVAVSAAALILTRPLVRRLTAGKPVPTNADRILGAEGKVTERIDNDNSTGAVYADGKTWTARSADGTVIPEGEQVVIESIDGVKLRVKKIKKPEVV